MFLHITNQGYLHLDNPRFNKAVFMYKIMTRVAPSYLSKRFKIIHGRYKDNIYIPLPRIDLFMTSLTFSGAKLWNATPKSLKNSKTLFSFKNAYVKHLFANCDQLTFSI